MLIAEEKSGEKLVFSGDGRFVNSACDVVQWFNEGGSNPLPLTDPQQRVKAGYERPEPSSEQPVFTHRIMDEETYLASLKREDAQNLARILIVQDRLSERSLHFA